MKMEIELTDAQAEKVQILKENGIGVGEAIEMFFDMKDVVSESTNKLLDLRIQRANEEKAKIKTKIAKIDEDLSFFDKITESHTPMTKRSLMKGIR